MILPSPCLLFSGCDYSALVSHKKTKNLNYGFFQPEHLQVCCPLHALWQTSNMTIWQLLKVTDLFRLFSFSVLDQTNFLSPKLTPNPVINIQAAFNVIQFNFSPPKSSCLAAQTVQDIRGKGGQIFLSHGTKTSLTLLFPMHVEI